MTIKSIFVIITAVIGLISFTAQNAFAYLDPASGSMLLQGILAGLAAVGVSIGIFWRRLKAFFYGGKKLKEEADDS